MKCELHGADGTRLQPSAQRAASVYIHIVTDDETGDEAVVENAKLLKSASSFMQIIHVSGLLSPFLWFSLWGSS